MDLRELVEYIDWTPFFHAWELRGVWDRANQVLKTKNPEGAAEAAKLYQDALGWIERIMDARPFPGPRRLWVFPRQRGRR